MDPGFLRGDVNIFTETQEFKVEYFPKLKLVVHNMYRNLVLLNLKVYSGQL